LRGLPSGVPRRRQRSQQIQLLSISLVRIPPKFIAAFDSDRVGVAVYYLCPLFAVVPPVSTLLTLDSGPANWVNLSSDRNQNSAVRWWMDGLENGPHQLVVSLGQSSTGQTATWGEVDAFMYGRVLNWVA
jgi:hypothetical protein